MRFLAASLFLSAAFDWPVPWVDRAGVAALGLFCLSLTVGAALPGRRSARPASDGDPLANATEMRAAMEGDFHRGLERRVADASDQTADQVDALEAWAKRY
jgi:hypothetical protein